MAEDNNAPQEQVAPKTGDVNISNDVVSIVASLAASSVKGVSGMVKLDFRRNSRAARQKRICQRA